MTLGLRFLLTLTVPFMWMAVASVFVVIGLLHSFQVAVLMVAAIWE